jgi:hypothetical protein
MIFEAAYNNGPNQKYPTANVIQTLWLKKVSPDPWQTDNQEDWLIGILDKDMSTTNGYLGQVQYNSRENGLSDWYMISYPTDFNFVSRLQVLQGPMAVNGIEGEGNQSELYFMDGIVASASDYGSPVYGYFDNEYKLMGIVGTQRVFNGFQVWVQGGPALWTLIATAKKVYP